MRWIPDREAREHQSRINSGKKLKGIEMDDKKLLEIIEQANIDERKALHLSNYGIKSLPAEIGLY